MDELLLSQAVEALLTAAVADGRSERTVRDYRQKLGGLLAFLGDRPVGGITIQDLRRYVADLRARRSRYADHPLRGPVAGGLSDASVASNVRVIRRLFSWLVEEGLLPESPAKRLPTPKPRRREPKAYRSEELVEIVAAATSARDRALVLFLADTGCRVGGLCGLRIQDVDLGQRTAIATEKGKQQRMLFFSPATGQALAIWLTERSSMSDSDAVFVSLTTGEPLTPVGVYQALRRIKERSGVEGPANPHAFRHGFAREYLINGGDLGSLADLLGHADVQTTWQSYAIFRQNELADKHDRHSPVAALNGCVS